MRIVLKDLQGGALVSVAGQPQVYTLDPGIGDPGRPCQTIPRDSPLGQDRNTAQNVFVETCQLPPVIGDQIHVSEANPKGHTPASPPFLPGTPPALPRQLSAIVLENGAGGK